jgi:hypothetical protein
VNDKTVAFVVYPGLTLTNDDLAPAVRLGLEYDPHPPHGGIDWSLVDRDMLAA